MNSLKCVISVLAVFCIVLLIVTSGCTGDNRSKAGFGNESNGTLMNLKPTVTADLSCGSGTAGAANCGLGPMCYNNCLKSADQPPTQQVIEGCERICCPQFCMDLPLNEVAKRHACNEDCSKKLGAVEK